MQKAKFETQIIEWPLIGTKCYKNSSVYNYLHDCPAT